MPSAFDTCVTATIRVRSFEQPLVLVEPQLAGIGHRDDAQPCALLLAEHLPRHDVRVMLHLGDRRSRRQLRRARGRRSGATRLIRLGRAANEHDFARVGGVEETAHRLPCRVVRRPWPRRSGHARRDGCWRSPRRSSARGDRSRLRLLRRRRVVEVDERLSVHALPQDRKLLADRPQVRMCRRGVDTADVMRTLMQLACSATREPLLQDAAQRLLSRTRAAMRFNTSAAKA